MKVRGTVRGLNTGLPPVQLPSVFIHQGIHFSPYMHQMRCKVSHLPAPQNSIQIPTTRNPTEANDKPVYGGSGEHTRQQPHQDMPGLQVREQGICFLDYVAAALVPRREVSLNTELSIRHLNTLQIEENCQDVEIVGL